MKVFRILDVGFTLSHPDHQPYCSSSDQYILKEDCERPVTPPSVPPSNSVFTENNKRKRPWSSVEQNEDEEFMRDSFSVQNIARFSNIIIDEFGEFGNFLSDNFCSDKF